MIRRLDLGHLARPASEAGEEHPRVESILAYLVRHDGACCSSTPASDLTSGSTPTAGPDDVTCEPR